MADPFLLDSYTARRKVLAAITPKFHIYDPAGALAAYVEQKAFKLKEDITIFGDEEKTRPLLKIKARSVLDVSATYDVADAASGQTVGALRHKGLKSIVQDEWSVLDTGDNEIGTIKEDSTMMALLRRFLSNLIPQSFHIHIGGQPAGVVKQRFNPFVLQHDVDLRADAGKRLDRRLALAAVVLLLAIEGRQD